MDTNDYTGIPPIPSVAAAENTAQLMRDVAYWRKRAETAEALVTSYEMRIARGQEALEIAVADIAGLLQSALEGRDE